MINNKILVVLGSALSLIGGQAAFAACRDVPRAQLEAAIADAEAASTGGYQGVTKMWITVVDETGKVCHVATSGSTGYTGSRTEWLGSRIISAQKANTANAFSLDNYVISTANLYTAVLPGGSLYGLQHSNPVDAKTAYAGSPVTYGTNGDPLKNKRIGGVNVFGGGLALYKDGHKVGAVGVSGDTSCRDHRYAWQVRESLGMHPSAPTVGITTVNFATNSANPPVAEATLAGATTGDEMILDDGDASGYWATWAHPSCPNSTAGATAVNGVLRF